MSEEQRVREVITSLSRITQAAARLTVAVHVQGRAVDLDEEIDHMQANLDRVRKVVRDGR